MRRLASLVLLASLAGEAHADAPASGPGAAASHGLAFVLTLRGSGAVLVAGPFSLKVPGATGPLRLELSRLVVDGSRLRGEARLRNQSGVLLSGLALDFVTATPARGQEGAPPTATALPVSLHEPLAFGDLAPGEETSLVPFELAPLPLGADLSLVTLLGSVSGVAAEPPEGIHGVSRGVALDADRYGRLYVATNGPGQVLRYVPASSSPPGEAARPSSAPAGVALRRRNGDLFVSTGGPLVEVWRPGRSRPTTLDAERPVTVLRVDSKDVLRAAAGNGVLAFDEAKAGPVRALGPEGATVLSFDSDARGTIHAVVREGETRRLAVALPGGPVPFAMRKGAGADALDTPSVCRFDREGALWVAAVPRGPESTVVALFRSDGTPLASMSRLALALLLGRDEDAAVPAVADLVPGPERRLYVLLEDGRVFSVWPF